MSTEKIFGQELVDQAEQYLSNLNGNAIAHLKDNRTKGLAYLKSNGFPGPKAEEYKFTRLTKAISGKFDFASVTKNTKLPLDKMEDIKKKHAGANILFFINGVYNQEHSEIVSKAEELRIDSLADRADAHELIAENEDAFQAQNNVYVNSGVVVEVPENKKIAQPVMCYYISVDNGGNFGFVKNIYLANEGSQADFVHFHLSDGSVTSFINETKNYLIKANAHIKVYKIQEESNQSVYVGNTHVYQERYSVFSSFVFTFDGEMVRNNLTIKVDGEGCESNMYGLYLAKGKTHIDNHTTVDHIQPNCNSNELYKGIIDDQARGVFNGKIYVRQAAQKTNAFQSNGNILLSDTATINTKPQLEIWADDVKCSHGCTTGQLDEEAIFYLRARGIDKAKAKSMILLANAAEVIEHINLGWLKMEITDKVMDRLHVD
ncbi:Fe-S cluster assembly protein SufD [Reichenbachiella agarivorans]|uniref:Fe-S cluster assembly protein SufD n=1 Tax=Reichenbachiella agarivorans TaxID=2979464 RepID=A0ABY6D0L0_9BACT|nr:Fe-S cluster assembly protein SufD [Reichenbachiella agarivorans]UXP34020.1 Fe-S cluster assembly protein SufD [Reichenbachiella agarivorans]